MRRMIFKLIGGKQKGLSLVETLVAIALVSTVGSASLSGLTTTVKATGLTESKTIAESLAQAQLEDIMRADFDNVNQPPIYAPITPTDSNYSITIESQNITFAEHTATTTATGLQKVTVEIYHGSKLVTEAETLKGCYD